MWHELVLNGVGGNTIAEAKSRISYPEFLAWLAYRDKRGSLNIGRRVEQAVGLLSKLLLDMNQKNDLNAVDFMPHENIRLELSEEENLMLAMQRWD
nr:hypothetical protein [Thiopseudomonas alkaliphila]